jgi:FG-GAP-like repeat
MRNLLTLLSFLLIFINAWAIDTYNPANGQLTIPMVRVGTQNYTNVVITLGQVVSVGTYPTPYAVDFYKQDLNQLIIPIVNVGSDTYNNVVVTVGNVLSIGGQLPATSPSSIVQASSYLNAKNIGIGSQYIPMNLIPLNPNRPELIGAGFAFGDFFQDGTLALVAGSGIFGGFDGYTSTVAGKLYFFHSDGKGGWIDQTNKLLDDQTGCIGARRLIVADFNGDGKPDVFVSCTGIDGAIPPGYTAGEHPRFLMSQANGSYKNIDSGFNCYCHYATAAEMNKKGFADIFVTDGVGNPQPYFLINNGDGTFTQNLNKTPLDALPYFFPGQTIPHPMNIYVAELIDINNDGKYDLFLAGDELGGVVCRQYSFCKFPPHLYLNDGTNDFTRLKSISFPPVPLYAFVLDIVFLKNYIYFNRVDDNSPVSIYGNSAIQKISWPLMSQSIIYTTPPMYALPNSYPNGTYQYQSSWIDWIQPFNGNIVSTNEAFNVSVPF